jgi:integrase
VSHGRRPLPKLTYYKPRKLGRVILDGERVYCGPWGSEDPNKPGEVCRKEYERVVGEWLRRKGETLADAPPLTVAELAARYLGHARAYYRRPDGSDSGHFPRVRTALDALVRAFGRKPAAEFSAADLKEVRTRLLARPRKPRPGERAAADRPLSRNYVNGVVGAIKTMWQWAAEEGLVPDERAAAVKVLKPLAAGRGGAETPPVLPPDPAAVEAALPYLPPTVRDMVRLHRLTGMRPQDVCAVRPGDISRRSDEVLRLKNGQRVSAVRVDGILVWVYAPPQHKTAHKRKPRLIALGPAAQDILGPYLDGRDPDAYCFSPRASEARRSAARRAARRTPLTPSQRSRGKEAARRRPPGARYTTESYSQAVARACARAGVEPWSPNQLRHAVADQVSEIADEDTAAAVLGNTPDVVRVYTLQRLGKAAAIMARVG